MAARFWIGPAGGDNNWSNINNWSLTSGGATVGAIPTNLDDVTFDGAANNACTLNTAVAKVAKTLTINGYTNTLTFNVNLSVSGNITFTTTGFTLTGAGLLRMIAAGTWTTNGKAIALDVEIGGTTTFTCTLADALNVTGSLNGMTLTNTTSTIFSGAFSITCPKKITVSGSQTVTLSGDWFCGTTASDGFFVLDACVFNGAFNINVTGGAVSINGATSGTATLVMTGTNGNITSIASAANVLSMNMTFNVTNGNTILIGNFVYQTGTITWIAGTAAGVGTMTLSGACTLNTGSFIWPNVLISAAITVTINSLLLVSGTLTMPNAAVTFAGTAGFTVGVFSNATITVSRIWTFTFGNTYTITTSFVLLHAAAQTVRFAFKSSSAGNKVAFVLQGGATQDLGFADPTDIDSSAGQTIFSFHGVITTTTNWSAALPVNVLPSQPRVVLAGSSH